MKKYLYHVMMDQEKGPIAGIVRVGLHLLSIIYRWLVILVVFFYKKGILKPYRLPEPVISIGNITWGGVGKTPIVALVADYLKGKKLKPVILIRGYMEKKNGSADSMSLSDAAVLLQEMLKDVPVLVGRDRM